MSIGAKIKDSRIVGTPYVAVFGNTLDKGYVEVENTRTGKKKVVEVEKFALYFRGLTRYIRN